MSGKSRNSKNLIKQLRVREETVSSNESNKPGTSVIVQQPQPATQNIDVMAYRLEQNELATRELKHEMSEGFKAIKDQITEFTNHFATREQLKEAESDINTAITSVSDRVKVLEDEKTSLLKKIAGIAVGVLVVMVLAFYGIDKFL